MYTRKFLNEVDVESVEKAINGLWLAFVWGDSPHGHQAWSNVLDSLQEIKMQAEACQHATQ